MMTASRHRFSFTTLRLIFAALSATILLAGCGSDKKESRNEPEEKDKPAQERVAILRARFDQLDRELEIQKKSLQRTQESIQHLRSSLVKGNLKGYSIDDFSSTDPLVLAALDKHADKKAKNTNKAEKIKSEEEKEVKEESENSFLNALLILLFLAFLIVIFVVLLKDRSHETQYDSASAAPYPSPEPEAEPLSNDTGGYQVLEPRRDDNHPSDEGNNQ